MAAIVKSLLHAKPRLLAHSSLNQSFHFAQTIQSSFHFCYKSKKSSAFYERTQFFHLVLTSIQFNSSFPQSLQGLRNSFNLYIIDGISLTVGSTTSIRLPKVLATILNLSIMRVELIYYTNFPRYCPRLTLTFVSLIVWVSPL